MCLFDRIEKKKCEKSCLTHLKHGFDRGSPGQTQLHPGQAGAYALCFVWGGVRNFFVRTRFWILTIGRAFPILTKKQEGLVYPCCLFAAVWACGEKCFYFLLKLTLP